MSGFFCNDTGVNILTQDGMAGGSIYIDGGAFYDMMYSAYLSGYNGYNGSQWDPYAVGGAGAGGGGSGPVDTTGFHRLPNRSKLPPENGYNQQPGQTCVFMTMQYVSDYVSGNAPFGTTLTWYASTYNKSFGGVIDSLGVDADKLVPLLSHFFSIQVTTSLSDAINAGYPVVATLNDNNIGHEVLITGYKTDNTIEYFDPLLATYKQKNISYFYYVYTILAPY